MNPRRVIDTRKRAMLVAALFALGYIGVAVKLVYLQVLRADDLRKLAARQQTSSITVPARRGAIYDRSGRELAVSVETYSLFCEPDKVKDPGAVAKRLAVITGAPEDRLRARLASGRSFAWLVRKAPPDVGPKVEAAGLKGTLGFVPDSRRYYPNRNLASHVLGFTGMDNEGLEGLEKLYDTSVGGAAGRLVIEKDGAGKEFLAVEDGYIPPRPANDLVLTIDARIQYIVEKELDALVAKYSPKSATAIVMDPNTGEVLAMASRPDFNPNSWNDYRAPSWRNTAVADIYEPGSTFKVVTASAALDSGVFGPKDIIDCGDGEVNVAGRIIHDSHRHGGRLSFTEIIQESNNVGAVKVGLKLGADRLYRYAKAFGIGERTGVDMPSEAAGMLREQKYWSAVSTASIAMGQEVGVTALQTLSVFNTIASGGRFIRPYVVSEVRTPDGKVVSRAASRKPRQVVSAKTARTMTEILSTVVEEGGTAVAANLRGYQVAGKTGTAQKYDPSTHGYSKDKYVSSFAGFAPADSPRVSAIVVVNEPKGQYYGGAVAAPAFKEIVGQTLTYMRAPTRLPEQTLLVEK